jgi:alpha-tubulin suppressor-like RCC1 family protein
MNRIFFFLIILFIGERSLGQVNAKLHAGWCGGFLTAGANGSSFKHFIVLSDGTLASFAPGETPQPFHGIDNVAAISASTFHILALKKDGTVWAWGENDNWQLGNREFAKKEMRSNVPVQVTGITNAIAISAIGENSYALLADGTVWAWGSGNVGMAGDGGAISGRNINHLYTGKAVPVQVKGITNAVAIAGAMALLADGTIVTWGDGSYGRLGNGTISHTSAPVKVSGIRNAVSIACREYGGLALLADGTVWAWGRNIKGQLGESVPHKNPNDHSSVPVQVKGLNNVVAIDAHHVCLALLKDGTVRAWGWGALGGMGTGRGTSGDVNAVPLKVLNVSNAVAIKAGNGYGIALLKNGTIMGWGANMVKEGVHHNSWTPVKIGELD